MSPPSLVLRGDQVRLRPVEGGDRDRLIDIRSTPHVRRWWQGDDLDDEFTDDLASTEAQRLAGLVADTAFGDRPVRLIQFAEETDPEFRHACIDIYLDPAVRRRGCATDAIRTVVAHLFDDLGHHRVAIGPAAANHGAIECYRRVGFHEVGAMRSYQRRLDGTWADGLLMELIAGTV